MSEIYTYKEKATLHSIGFAVEICSFLPINNVFALHEWWDCIRNSQHHNAKGHLKINVSQLPLAFQDYFLFCMQYTRYNKYTIVLDPQSDLTQFCILMGIVRQEKKKINVVINYKGVNYKRTKEI